MSDITDLANSWLGSINYAKYRAADEARAVDSLRSRALADWAKLRPKIMDAISAIALEFEEYSAYVARLEREGKNNNGLVPFTLKVVPPSGGHYYCGRYL